MFIWELHQGNWRKSVSNNGLTNGNLAVTLPRPYHYWRKDINGKHIHGAQVRAAGGEAQAA